MSSAGEHGARTAIRQARYKNGDMDRRPEGKVGHKKPYPGLNPRSTYKKGVLGSCPLEQSNKQRSVTDETNHHYKYPHGSVQLYYWPVEATLERKAEISASIPHFRVDSYLFRRHSLVG